MPSASGGWRRRGERRIGGHGLMRGGHAAGSDIVALCEARHPDPFAVLGPHRRSDGTCALRAFLPGAASVLAVAAEAPGTAATPLGVLQPHGDTGFFEGLIPDEHAEAYRLQVRWDSGVEQTLEDPYRFPPLLGDTDVWLLAEGTHRRPWQALGAHPLEMQGVAGTRFAVWAPNATRVSVVGDFNHWDGRRFPMRLRRECGVWEVFLPGVGPGARYKFEIRDRDGRVLPHKADPYARRTELRPATASVVAAPYAASSTALPPSRDRAPGEAMSVYEVHAGSWRRHDDPARPFLSWDELADSLVPYVADLGFTHLELLPVSEHPFDGSWGYQPTGLYAPTARHGDPEGLRRFVARAHATGLGVLLDWVPAHFPADMHGLARFDGTALYEHEDPREGFHPDWNTLIYNFSRREVRNFLIGSALYWLEAFGVDGLRIDAVASMLYRDYSRKPGEWLPNAHGGRENLEAIAFLRELNAIVAAEHPQALMIAEESTAFPGVTRSVPAGGLGFHQKWNMGWMNDTLRYVARDPVHRRHHHDEMTFGLVYAWSERFMLPLSHDEVVHGKRSLLGRMPGDDWQRHANLRAYLGFMYGHPGRKLLFMGGEFAQPREWDHDRALDWQVLGEPRHAGVQRLVRDLNRLYQGRAALHARDDDPGGFEWIDPAARDHSVYAFLRHGPAPQDMVLVVCNFTPTVHAGWRIGVPGPGRWREALNTDSRHYGGSDQGTPLGAAEAEAVPAHGRSWSLALTLPPLATVFLERQP
jgi:1,4-alpha-glucan branching enzyme